MCFNIWSQHNITFSVNLSTNVNFNPTIHDVYVSGARFNSSEGLGDYAPWPMPGSNAAFLMSSSDNVTYQITFEDNPPGAYAYKYFLVENGQATWNLGEWPGTNNRILVVDNTDVQTNDSWGVIVNQEVHLRINEVMASNGITAADEDGDFEDWIEIYNAGSQPVNLNGFGLSDNLNNPLRWTFPSIFILPNSYLTVWASGKNRIQSDQPLHTNFSISSSGETLVLADETGAILDLIPAVQHQTDVAYGRFPDGSDQLAYLSNPTPNSANQGPAFDDLAQPLSFSLPEGYYDNPISVAISSSDPSAVIRYTLDGSEPKENSPIYNAPLQFDNLADVPNVISTIPTNNQAPGPPFYEGWQPPQGNVYKINVLRAKAFSSLTPPAPSYNATYIIDPALHQRYSLPVMSFTSDFDHLFDPQTGMYVYGVSGNYWQDWERPGNFTYFLRDGSLGFNENSGFQLNGNTSRNRPRKSIRMVFRNQYGNSWLDYPIFENKSTERYKRLILRNAGNDWGNTLIRDGLSQILAKDFHVETQYFQPTILFINGEYWGIHNLRDRYSTHYFEAKYGIEAHELTVMENNSAFKRGNPNGISHYNNLIAYIENNDMSMQSAYQQILQRMDVESFIDFQITHIYPKNTDWPGNNVMYWRYLRDGFEPYAGMRDGRWRWLIFDLDFAFDLDLAYVPFLNEGAAHNTLEFALQSDGPAWPNPNWSTLMLRKLMANDSFKIQFVNRYCDLLNTVYRPEFVVHNMDSLKDMLLPEMQEHINRWRRPESLESWLNEIELLKQFVHERAEFQYQHLQATLGFGEKYTIIVDVNDANHGFVQLNTIDLREETNGISSPVYPWQGEYLHGAPITLRAIPQPGFVFSHWSGDFSGNIAVISLNPHADLEIKAHFIPVENANFELLHFWFFGNSLANNTPLLNVAPTYETSYASLDYESCLVGYPFESGHPNWRKASMERRNAPTALNYSASGNNDISYAASNIRGLQVRQPFRSEDAENTIFLKFSTKDHEKIMLRMAVLDEGAASALKIDYRNPDFTSDFSSAGIVSEHTLFSEYHVIQVNFDEVEAANNADTLVIRIRFLGENLNADMGNRVTLNNISISGVPISEEEEIVDETGQLPTSIFPNPAEQKVFIQVSAVLLDVEFYNVSSHLAARYDTSGNAYLNVADLAAGIYFVRLNYENGRSEVKRFIKVN